MEDYIVPKIQIKTEIHMCDHQASDNYILFLWQFSRQRLGSETIDEYLETKDAFIPAKRINDNRFLILNKNEILYLKETEKTQIKPLKKIRIYLPMNIELSVLTYKELPPLQRRTLDYLNINLTFLPFIHQKYPIFINKRKIIKVEEI